MRPEYKKNQIVVVTNSCGGNMPGTITKIILNPLEGKLLDNGGCVNAYASVVCEGNTRSQLDFHRKYCNKNIWEEIYIRPATTHEKIARRKGIYLPKARKTFNQLTLGDTIMMQHNQHFIELKIDAIHRLGAKTLDVGAKPVNLKKEFKNTAIKEYYFLTEDQLIMSSAPPIK